MSEHHDRTHAERIRFDRLGLIEAIEVYLQRVRELDHHGAHQNMRHRVAASEAAATNLRHFGIPRAQIDSARIALRTKFRTSDEIHRELVRAGKNAAGMK